MTLPTRTVSDFIASVSKRLNDHRADVDYIYIRWTQEELTDYLNDALRVISGLRPDQFTENVTHTLKPGCSLQESPCACGILKLEYTDSCNPGRPTTPTKASETRASYLSYFSGCDADGNETGANADLLADPDCYKVDSWFHDPDNPSIFYVYPRPPLNGEVKVLLSCRGTPERYEWPGDGGKEVVICEEYEPAIIEYMLYQAYQKDIESETSRRRKVDALANFYRYLGLKRIADYTYHRPDYFLQGPFDGQVFVPSGLGGLGDG